MFITKTRSSPWRSRDSRGDAADRNSPTSKINRAASAASQHGPPRRAIDDDLIGQLPQGVLRELRDTSEAPE
jgi:hypothetical protein